MEHIEFQVALYILFLNELQMNNFNVTTLL